MPSPAELASEPILVALMPDPVGHRAVPASVQLTLSQLCTPPVVMAQSLNCGGSISYHEKDGPRGYPTPPCDEEGYPRDNPLPGNSPMTSSQRCTGTDDGLSQTVSGVTPATAPPMKRTTLEVIPITRVLSRSTLKVNLSPVSHR